MIFSVSLLRHSVIFFLFATITQWNTYMRSAFKSLSDNSDICVILLLSSISCLGWYNERNLNILCITLWDYQFSPLQSLSRVWLFATPWTSLSITNSWSLLKLMSVESVMPSNHLILCCPLLLLPSIFTSIWVFPMSQLFTSGGQSIGASASVLPMHIQDWFSLGLTGWIMQSKGLSRIFSNTTVQKHQYFGTQLSLWCNSHILTWLLEKP